MKDKGSDHKGEKKKKSQRGDYEGVLEESQMKNGKHKDKMMEPKRKDKSDFELAKEKKKRVREEGEVKKKKHKNKKERKRKELDYAGENDGVGYDGSVESKVGKEVTENVEPVPDKKRKKKKGEKDLGADLVHGSDVHSINREEGRGESGSKKKKEKSHSSNTEGDVNTENQMGNEVTKRVHSKEDKKTKKKKKNKGADCTPSNEENSRGGVSKKKGKPNGFKNTEKDADAGASKAKKRKRATETSEQSTSSKKSKRVRFSDQDEVFSLPDNDSSKGEKVQEAGQDRHTSADGLVRGKRFSKEEDEIVKNAVLDYIESHQLGEEGIEMVMKCKNYPEIRDCWKEIGESLPWRPYTAVYYRAHILFERGEKRKWSEEELELVRKFHEKHGANWRQLADELGKHRFHVKDTWRRIKLPNRKKGQWSQEEYQSLFDLVNVDLSMKLLEEKKSKHGMLRDNISWEAISEKLDHNSKCSNLLR